MIPSSLVPVGSAIFVFLALLLISFSVLLVLRQFLTLRATPAFLTVPVFLALVLPASVVLLVPIDLASDSRDGSSAKGIWLPEQIILVLWKIAYWLIFVLTWVILPLLGEFVDSGYQEPKDRLLYSLRSNLRYHLTILGCGIIGLVYISIQNGLDITTLKALVMALAYVWGLVLAIYLMGHGLVSVPRSLFRHANNADTLMRIQAHAPRVYDRLTDAITELEDLELTVAQLQRRETGTARDFKDWIGELAESTSLPESRPLASQTTRDSATAVPAVITQRYLAELTRRLQRARHQRARFLDEWDRLVQSAADCQAILNSVATKKLEFVQRHPEASFPTQWNFLTPYMRYELYVRILPFIRISLSAVFSVASVCVIYSELIKSFAPQISAISFSVASRPANPGVVGLRGEITASLWLLYMSLAALAGVNDAKVWGNRALVRRNTYGESACWYAGQIARLTVPLSYNFLTLLPKEVRHRTAFYKLLGSYIDLTPLGKGFDYFFPVFVLFPVFATLFHLYGRVRTLFGFGLLDDGDDADGSPGDVGIGGWREGRELINRELSGMGSIGLISRTPGHPLASNEASQGRPPRERAAGDELAAEAYRVSRPATPVSSRPMNVSALDEDEDEDEDENSVQSFIRRVRNTFETAPTPRWLQASLSRFQQLRWGADDSHERGQGPGRGGVLARWFGGRAAQGAVRL